MACRSGIDSFRDLNRSWEEDELESEPILSVSSLKAPTNSATILPPLCSIPVAIGELKGGVEEEWVVGVVVARGRSGGDGILGLRLPLREEVGEDLELRMGRRRRRRWRWWWWGAVAMAVVAEWVEEMQ